MGEGGIAHDDRGAQPQERLARLLLGFKPAFEDTAAHQRRYANHSDGSWSSGVHGPTLFVAVLMLISAILFKAWQLSKKPNTILYDLREYTCIRVEESGLGDAVREQRTRAYAFVEDPINKTMDKAQKVYQFFLYLIGLRERLRTKVRESRGKLIAEQVRTEKASAGKTIRRASIEDARRVAESELRAARSDEDHPLPPLRTSKQSRQKKKLLVGFGGKPQEEPKQTNPGKGKKKRKEQGPSATLLGGGMTDDASDDAPDDAPV